ncbi:MAG: type II toxin-antitoxin system RelE/ParE family toxin [Elusimicrobiota bacterium]
MAYRQRAYPKYNRLKKKFPDPLKKRLNKAENKVAETPLIGKEKGGDLKGIRIYKFNFFDQLYLLAYKVNEEKEKIIFAAIGGHGNFYRDLKRYLNK